MLFKLISCQIQGMCIDRILPECFVRRVCHWQRSLINKAMAERLEEGSRWKSPVSILKEKHSCSRLLGPTAAGLLNGVEHSTLWWKACPTCPWFLGTLLVWFHHSHATLCLLLPRLPGKLPVPLGITAFAASDFSSASKPTQFNHHGHVTTSDQGLCYKWSRLGVVLQQQQGGCFLLDMPFWKEQRGRSTNMFLFLIHGVFTIISYFFLLTAISR